MIKLMLAFLLFSVTIGCDNTHRKTPVESETVTAHNENQDSENASGIVNNNWVDEIVLNNGSKWEANKETTQGVANMLDLIKNNNKENLNDYHELAIKLNDEKNILVKKCTMKGPSHDNLHIFLHPLIEKIDALIIASSLDEAISISKSIRENLELYNTFFK
jgi:CRISPR/Cas system CSM-associated protein Csm2 small subunit